MMRSRLILAFGAKARRESSLDRACKAIMRGVVLAWLLTCAWVGVEAQESHFATTLPPLLKHGDPEVRGAGAVAIARLGMKDQVRQVARLLEDKEPEVLANAIMALGILEAKEYSDQIAAHILSPDFTLRFAAIRALGSTGGERHADKIATILIADAGNDMNLVTALGRTLGKIGTQRHADLMAELLKERGLFMQEAASLVLARLGERRHIQALELLLDHPMGSVRDRVAKTIARIDPSMEAAVSDYVEGWQSAEYYDEADASMGDSWEKEFSVEELLEAAGSRRLIVVGERHWFPGGDANGQRGQEAQVRIMRALAKERGKWVLGFEPCVRAGYRERAVRDGVLEEAKALGWEAVGLERESDGRGKPFRTRDLEAAEAVCRCLSGDADTKVFVVYGAAHVLGPQHIGDRLGGQKPITILLQGDRLYWKVAREKQRVRLADRVYELRAGVYYWPVEVMPGLLRERNVVKLLELLDKGGNSRSAGGVKVPPLRVRPIGQGRPAPGIEEGWMAANPVSSARTRPDSGSRRNPHPPRPQIHGPFASAASRASAGRWRSRSG